MSTPTQTTQKWAVASVALQDAYTDFILSRQAMLCTPQTLRFYSFTAGRFINFLEENDVGGPEEITSRLVRAYLADLAARGLADSTIHGHARAIKTFTRFCHQEGYSKSEVQFQMPSVEKKRQPVLNGEELGEAIKACRNPRDEALVLFLADTGVRRGELVKMTWGDVNIETGMCHIAKGKGKKARMVVVGVRTRRALLKYRRQIDHSESAPLFQTVSGRPLKANGVRSALLRIGKRAGVHLSPHILRRTFATLSLREGMSVLHLQSLLGHSTLEMTRHYLTLLDDDLAQAHQRFGPVDNL